MRVLVVEDERSLNDALFRGLTRAGYCVDQAYDGEDGLQQALINDYDVIILDLSLPKLDGVTLCKTLRSENCASAVIMLTARDSIEDRVKGLDTGADDYLIKPFSFAELLARLRCLVRRGSDQRSPVIQVANITLNTVTREVFRDGRAIQLSSKEYSILEFFMLNPRKVLTRQMITEHAWDYEVDPDSNVVDVYIRYLRRKLKDESEPKLIQTVRGAGYRLKG